MTPAASTDAGGAGRRHQISRRRRAARLAAVQALYQLELNPGMGVEAVIREFASHRFGREIGEEIYGEPDAALFADIVRGVVQDRDRLDEAIAASLTEKWPLARLETILRVLLEAGAFEIIHRRDIPPRVTLSEYVGLAHAFFAGREPSLANGVLDHLARTLRADEL